MPHTPWNDKPLMLLQVDHPILKIDDEVPIEHEEELVVVLLQR